ncbi:MAG: hypothetical protein HRU35_07225 [Rickettsiaceae bacterium]|nr:hypothetical protein [Rickettsiaceae bacterium]
MAKYVKSTFKLTPNNLFFHGDFYQNRSYKWGINDAPIPTTGYGYTIFNTFYNLLKTTSLEYNYYTLSKLIKNCNYSEAVNQC